MVDLSSIQNAALLDGLTESDIQALESIGLERRTKKGECLFNHGEVAETLYLVKDGRFALTIQVRALDEHFEMPVEEKVAGDAFGWSALVEPHQAIYSAYCTRDGLVVAFSRGDLEGLMSSDPNLGRRFLHNLNLLIGSRIRPLLQLWIAEIERSIERVEYWSHTKLSDEWADAVKPSRKIALWRRHSSS